MRALMVSNGSGEDRIAVALARAWQQQEPDLELEALALVGKGDFYTEAQIPLRPVFFSPPSQGFAYLHPGLLLKDLHGGLGGHLQRVWQELGRIQQRYSHVIAVGDIVSLLVASRLQAKQAFVACALSDHYIAERSPGKTSFDPFQIGWLRRHQTLTFTRDALTAANLQARGVKARFYGNPMVDAFDDVEIATDNHEHTSPATLVVLPGSRQDALANFKLILEQLRPLQAESLQVEIVLAPQLMQAEFELALQQSGLSSVAQGLRFYFQPASVFKKVLASADLALGLAGTANEQAVAKGLPVVSFHGNGKQYTAAFAEAQQRLLGRGLTYLGTPCPELISWQIKEILANPHYRQVAQQVARERFGPPGATDRIISVFRQNEPASGPQSPSQIAHGGSIF